MPQVLLRTGGSLAIAALGIGLHLSLREDGGHLKDLMIRWISRWALGGTVLILVGGVWYLAVMPEHAQLNLIRAPILLSMTMINFLVTLLVMAALPWGHFAGSRWITPPAALLLFLAGAAKRADANAGKFCQVGNDSGARRDRLSI